ncbi:Cof-type HAD-IIB family hydrolase [Bacillus sp. Marseille-P3661]|uniref:Cof-type HAD-IIB family hydrolase n=1 Tax=Bacillus sp. Marseille-P3661 TaxID=1936234 RepID=UPI000C85CC25|nr:Cof-type HAD-IIB family hydrolase [Bacillus sp. Marseille-P3661]
MKQHLIALDLDGTLLTDEKTISDRTLKTIQEVRHRGHVVMISTGRPFRASQIYYQQLQLDTPIVNFNGAHIHHPKDETWGNYHSPMDLDVAKQIIDTCNKFNIYNILAEIKDDVYIHYYDETIMEIVSMGNPLIQTGSLADTLKFDPTSILIHPNKNDVETIRHYLSKELGTLIDHRKWGAPWHVIEVVKSGINKAVGVSKVADSFNIPPERIIAFGDEDNDLEMLEFAGYGVAMGNAIEEVKSIANEITETNEEDGLAAYLEEFFDISI